MLKKLILVYNPRSSHHGAIEREVLSQARRLSGWLVGKYEVRQGEVRENAKELMKILQDGNLVVALGGDGTASMAMNAIMLSGKDVTFAVLGYGNFNDTARMLKTKRPVEYGGEYIGGLSEIIERFEAKKITEIYPLEVKVDGKHWRYALNYFTVGMLAEATGVFEEEKVRKRLQSGKTGVIFALYQAVKWYFKNKKREFLGGNRSEYREEEKAENEVSREEGIEASQGEAEEIDNGVELKESGKEEVEPDEEKASSEVERDEEEAVGIGVEPSEEKGAGEAEKALGEEKEEKTVNEAEKREDGLKRSKKGQLEQKAENQVKMMSLKMGKVAKKLKSGAVELGGRSKARMLDLKVQTQVKVAETRQKRQKKHEEELANQPEIIIDTELTRKRNDESKKEER